MYSLAKTFTSKLSRLKSEFIPAADPFDRETGARTSGYVSLFRLRVSSRNKSHGTRYQPIDPGIFRAAIAAVPERSSDFTFVDLGCGKGRALLLASKIGFKEIIGIEFSKKLALCACENVMVARCRRCSVQCMDASEFEIPCGPVVVFMYNPFGPAVLTKVLENISRHSGTAYIVYVNSRHSELLDRPDFSRISDGGSFGVWTTAKRG
jgi:SAM-dependent methyltransferase